MFARVQSQRQSDQQNWNCKFSSVAVVVLLLWISVCCQLSCYMRTLSVYHINQATMLNPFLSCSRIPACVTSCENRVCVLNAILLLNSDPLHERVHCGQGRVRASSAAGWIRCSNN